MLHCFKTTYTCVKKTYPRSNLLPSHLVKHHISRQDEKHVFHNNFCILFSLHKIEADVSKKFLICSSFFSPWNIKVIHVGKHKQQAEVKGGSQDFRKTIQNSTLNRFGLKYHKQMFSTAVFHISLK